MIKNVIFDLGRVIYNYSPREDLIKLGIFGEKANLFMDRIYDAPIWKELDRGTCTVADGIKKLCKDYPDMAADIKKVFINENNNVGDWVERVIYVMPESLDFFYEVKSQGFKIYILTNFPEDAFAFIRARDPFFDDADGIVVSAHEKLIKPDPAIYQCLLDRYDLKPKETLFIDDLPLNTAAAKSLGIRAIQFKDIDDCKRRFAECIRLNMQAEI